MHANRPSSRRDFLKGSLAGAAAIGTAGLAPHAVAQEEPTLDPPLPTRPVGRSGIEVSILNQGGMMSSHSPTFLDVAWNKGMRYFDTADCYVNGKSEQNIGAWLRKYPERRKDLFLVTKDHPRQGPREMLTQIDRRLENIGATDYVDLFFLHGLGPGEYGGDSANWPKSDEFKQTVEQLKSSGKARLVGFSTHDNEKVQQLNAAAEGGFIDAIMVAYDPLARNEELDRAIDRCVEAGIGIIAMKTLRPHGNIPRQIPELESTGLNAHQLILQTVWSDERFCSICSHMANYDQMNENVEACRKFTGPLAPEQKQALREVAMLIGPSLCPGCDGRCERACGTQLALSDIARFVNYYERDGLTEARDYFAALAREQRSLDGADLAAAREACHSHLDFEGILRRAGRYFA